MTGRRRRKRDFTWGQVVRGEAVDLRTRSVVGICSRIASVRPSIRRLRVAPVLIAGLDHVSARHETPYGIAEASWMESDGQIRVRAVVPANTTAVVELPGADTVEVGSVRTSGRSAIPGQPRRTRSQPCDGRQGEGSIARVQVKAQA